ncbi:MAG: hypothetical protein ACR2NP_02410 [Pirellulaceae bacterium]
MARIVISVCPSVILIVWLLAGCAQPFTQEVDITSQPNVREAAEAYFATYAERKDWDHFLSFYDADLKFEDQRLRMQLDDKQAFSEFYNWPDERFRLADPDGPALVVDELAVDGNTAVARGRFMPFYWDEQLQDWPGEFVIWLTFNEARKIVGQRDYIPYPKSLLPD